MESELQKPLVRDCDMEFLYIFFDFSMRKAETFALLINQINLINSNKIKSVNEKEVINNVLFKFLGGYNPKDGKNISISACSNLLLEVFIIVFANKYCTFFRRNAIDYLVLFALK